MYLHHFGLTEPPFRITPHTDFFFDGANRGATLEALVYAITQDEGIVKVVGEVGSGKTMLCRVLLERLPAPVDTIYLANPSLTRDEMLHAIADELDIDTSAEGGRTTKLLRQLQEHLIRSYGEGRRVVVLIDEAHAMPKETLEEIRLLSNLESNRHKLLQIVMFGQPELDIALSRADMRQLKERITQSLRLEPMVRGDIQSYIDFRMRAAGYKGPNVFSPGAIRMIAAASEGLSRRVNILADKSLLAAFAANTHAVTEAEVRRAIKDSEFYKAPRRYWRHAAIAAAVLACVVAGWFLRNLLDDKPPPAPEPAKRAQPEAVPTEPQPVAAAGSNPPMSSGATPGPQERPATAAIPSAAPAAAPSAIAPSAALTASPSAAPAASLPGPSAPAAPPVATATTPDRSGAPPAEANAATDAALAQPTPVPRGRMSRSRYLATQQWLEPDGATGYSIQLMTVRIGDTARMEDFLRRASRLVGEDQLHVYSVKIGGIQHYRAAFGQYATASAAVEAIQTLPQAMKVQRPYQRSVERMRSQNRQ